MSNQIFYNFIVICTISVHCSTVEVQSGFLLIIFSSFVYFTDCNCNMTGANVFVSFRLYIYPVTVTLREVPALSVTRLQASVLVRFSH